MAAIEARQAAPVKAGRARFQAEQETILKARRYEQEAVEQLFDDHLEGLFRYVDSLVGDPAATEEVVRRTWQRALEGLPRYRRFDSGFGTWLRRIAGRQLAQAPLPAGTDPEASLRAAIRRLPPDQMEVMGLRFIAGLPVDEVARATGRSRGRVEALQQQALVAIRDAEAS